MQLLLELEKAASSLHPNDIAEPTMIHTTKPQSLRVLRELLCQRRISFGATSSMSSLTTQFAPIMDRLPLGRVLEPFASERLRTGLKVSGLFALFGCPAAEWVE